MIEIKIPFNIKGIPMKPELTGYLKMDETILQTIAALCGWDGEARRLLTCSVGGSLNTISPRVKVIINRSGDGDHDLQTFEDSPTSEVLLYADETNTGVCWVNVDAVAAIGSGYPLYSGDNVKLSINNLLSLQVLFAKDGDNLCIVQTV